VFTELLRQSFPDRFQGKQSSELGKSYFVLHGALELSRVLSILYSNDLINLQTC